MRFCNWFGLTYFASLLFLTGCTLDSRITNLSTSNLSSTTNPKETPKIPAVLDCDKDITSMFGGGSGTVSDPYAICSVAQWKMIASNLAYLSKSFKLYSDLDFTGVTYADFKIIGDSTNPFTGNVDGNGYAIKSLSLSAGTNPIALFANTNGPVTIKNLTLKDVALTSSNRISGLILNHGTSGPLTLKNVTINSMTFIFTNSSLTKEHGGLVGNTLSDIVADQVTLNSVVFNVTDTTRYVGGMVGTVGSNSSLGLSATLSNINVNSFTIPNVSGISHHYAGGLIGAAYGPLNLTDASMSGINININFSNYAGGVAGFTYGQNQFLRVKVGGVIKASISGGLIGSFDNYTSGPYVTFNHTFTETSFEGDLSTAGNGSGGITSNIYDNVTVTRSHFKLGDARVSNSSMGGLFGYVGTGTINVIDTYVSGNLTNTSGFGGFVGGFVGSLSATTFTMSRSFFAGTITTSSGSKACIALGGAPATYNDVYYNSTTCTATASGSGSLTGVTGLTTGAFQTATPFTNWLTSVWTFTSGQNPKHVSEP